MGKRAATVWALLLLLLVALTACQAQLEPEDDDEALDLCRHKDKGPWFYHGRDGPNFKTLERHNAYSLRRYGPSKWAGFCMHDVTHPEAIQRGTAHLLRYIRGKNSKDKSLWGAVPFGETVAFSLGALEAWNATSMEELEAAVSSNNDTLSTFVHKTVCIGYFLPCKYQGKGSRPPRPERGSPVRVLRLPRWEAYVTGFGGFPSPMRFIFNFMRMRNALLWDHRRFEWRVGTAFVYDPPDALKGRWNEALIPARRMEDLVAEGEDVFAEGVDGPDGVGPDDA